ncbi:MAG: DUF2232 domain-containing protein [Xylanivirga thermophila]|jgi:uncharacterized protein YybS (DUF2232 family)|uniref:DUF2232 domain-containing protein n=1 Tax=Xylanivirga thermophila TaxID=2496273 RepID=UPI0039F5B06E
MSLQDRGQPVLEAILVSIISTLAMAGMYMVPFLNSFVFLWPVPIAIVAVKYNNYWLSGIGLGVAAAVISFLDPSLAIITVLVFSIIVFILPWSIKKRPGIFEGAAICAAAMFIALIIVLKVLSSMVGQDIFTYSWDAIRQFFDRGGGDNFNKVLEMYKKIGLIEHSITGPQFAELLIDKLKVMVPSILIIFSMVAGGVDFLLASVVLKKMQMDAPYIPPFVEWKLPGGTGKGFFTIIVVAFIGALVGIKNFDIVLSTVLAIFSFIFSIQGLAFSSFLLKMGRIPTWIRVLLLFVFYLFFQGILIFMGVFEQMFNIRDNYRNPPTPRI